MILVSVLRRRIGNSILDGFLIALVKTIVATIFMCVVGAAIICLMRKLPDGRWFNILRLAAVVPSATVIYLLTAKILHIEMLSLLTGRKVDKTKPPQV